MPILTGVGPNQRGPKSGQDKLADLDALAQSKGYDIIGNGIFFKLQNVIKGEKKGKVIQIKYDCFSDTIRPNYK